MVTAIKHMKLKPFIMIFTGLLGMWSCKEDRVNYATENTAFQNIQIQKFDYLNLNGTGKIYQGLYSPNEDTLYFHITHFPDEEAATFTDWKIQGTILQGARVEPSISGIQDFTQPKSFSVIASDGINRKEVVVKLLIYQIDYGELEHGFGRYKKLFEKNTAALGISEAATKIAVVENYLVLNNGSSALQVLDKLTGNKVNLQVKMPVGFQVNSLFTDDEGLLLAANYASFSPTSSAPLHIYRWTNGLEQAPELLASVNLSAIPNTGWISRIALKGSSRADAQLLLEIGSATATTNAAALTIIGGKVDPVLKVFNKVVSSTWNSKVLPMSNNKYQPFLAVGMGFPAALAYQDGNGTKLFEINSANSNFYNFLIAGAYYFEFNGAKYLLASSVNWASEYKVLIFNVDDPSLISEGKSNAAAYALLNPFEEFVNLKDQTNTGEVTAQVAANGKSAFIYVLSPGSGIAAYELTNIGGKK